MLISQSQQFWCHILQWLPNNVIYISFAAGQPYEVTHASCDGIKKKQQQGVSSASYKLNDTYKTYVLCTTTFKTYCYFFLLQVLYS